MTRTTSRLAAAGFAVLLLAGCGGGESRAGAAATVGEENIATSDLESFIERGLSNPQAEQQFGSDRAEYQRQVLNRLVRAELLEQAAQDEDLEVTQGDVDAQLAEFAEQAGGREQLEEQAAAGGINAQDLPSFAREIVLEMQLGDSLTEDVEIPAEQIQALYDENAGQFDQVGTRHILVAEEAQARDLLAQVQADPARFPELATQFSTDTGSAQNGGDLGLAGRGQFVPPFEEAAFGAKPGDIVLAQTEFGWHVIEVLERQTTTLEEAEPDLRRQALAEQRGELVTDALRAKAEEVGVEVNPRFGRWDAEQVEVIPVPEEDGLSKPAPGGSGQPAPGGAPAPGGGQPAPQGEAPPGGGSAPAPE